MFEKQKGSKSDNSPTQNFSPAPAPPVEVATSPVKGGALIGASVTINGNVSGAENITIEGQVDGSIDFSSHEVVIGKSGRVSADITAKTIRIDGEVEGDIAGHEKVVISKTGKVQGNIVAPRVTLEDGAKFKGSIDMDPSERGSAHTANIRSTDGSPGNSGKTPGAVATSVSSKAQ